MGVGQLSESDAVDALRLPFYSSSHPTGSPGWRNQFDLGNPELIVVIALAVGIKVADSVRVDEFWAFLSTIMEPMGIGFLILVASEILNRMGRRHKGGA